MEKFIHCKINKNIELVKPNFIVYLQLMMDVNTFLYFHCLADSQPASRVLNVDSSVPDNQLSAQIALTVSQLQKDRDALLEKIRNMENTVKSLQVSLFIIVHLMFRY